MRSIIFSCTLVVGLGATSELRPLNDPEEGGPGMTLNQRKHSGTLQETSDLFQTYARDPSNKDILSADELLRGFKSRNSCSRQIMTELEKIARDIVTDRITQKRKAKAESQQVLPKGNKGGKKGGGKKEVLYS